MASDSTVRHTGLTVLKVVTKVKIRPEAQHGEDWWSHMTPIS